MRKWRCPTCGRVRATAFCPICGEEALRARDLGLRDLTGRFLISFSSLDGRFARSFRTLLTRPGMLAEAYVAGRRRAYLGPLQMFLLANALFFAVQSFTQFDIFSSPLDSHLNRQDWSALARPLIAERLADLGLGLQAFAPAFDSAAELNAKALIILMALAFVPLLWLAFPGARRQFGAHIVFALHLYAFILLLFCVSLLIVEAHVLAGGAGLASPSVDIALTLFNTTACASYLYFASSFYGSRGIARVAKSIVLALAIAAIVLAYRFAIFLITLYTT